MLYNIPSFILLYKNKINKLMMQPFNKISKDDLLIGNLIGQLEKLPQLAIISIIHYMIYKKNSQVKEWGASI